MLALRRLKVYYMLGALLAGLSGCTDRSAPPVNPSRTPQTYFNLSGFIAQQVKELTAARAPVQKTVISQPGSPETYVAASVDWAHELETFAQADVNKPALRSAYDVTTAAMPAGLTKTTYRKRAGDTPVEYLEISTTPDNRVTHITGRQTDRNYLVNSYKEFSLTCAPVNGQNRLQTYRVAGTQKTIFFTPLRFEVRGRVQ